MFSGRIAKLHFDNYLKVKELTSDETLNNILNEIAYNRNPAMESISICRNGNISPKWMKSYSKIIIHYNNDLNSILQECQKLMLYLYPKYDKLEPMDCDPYKSWSAVRKFSKRDVFFLNYIENLNIPIKEAKLLYNQMCFLTLLGLTKIRFNSNTPALHTYSFVWKTEKRC